jgi:hypothetical protein
LRNPTITMVPVTTNNISKNLFTIFGFFF